MYESWLSKIFFLLSEFVSELALFCISNVQLITDVYNHRCLRRFTEQRYLLNNWGACSDCFIVLQLVVGLLNICTINVISVKKPETHFWCELATEWFFDISLLPHNVKLTLDCCHYATRVRLRRQYLFSVLFGCLNSNILMSFAWNRSFFQKFLSFRLMPKSRAIVIPT